MNPLFHFFIILLSLNFVILKVLDYRLVFEYLYSDEKDIYEIELYSRPKATSLDFGDDIFYSGQIEKIENFPVSKLINFTKEDFSKNNKKEEIKKQNGKESIKEEKKIEKKIDNEEKEETIKDKKKQEIENEFDIFDDIFFGEPLIRRIFDNDYNKFLKFIKEQYLQNKNIKIKDKQNQQN